MFPLYICSFLRYRLSLGKVVAKNVVLLGVLVAVNCFKFISSREIRNLTWKVATILDCTSTSVFFAILCIPPKYLSNQNFATHTLDFCESLKNENEQKYAYKHRFLNLRGKTKWFLNQPHSLKAVLSKGVILDDRFSFSAQFPVKESLVGSIHWQVSFKLPLVWRCH